MALEYKGGKGLWSEYIDTDTKESSIKLHEPKEIQKFCEPKAHIFKALNSSSREVICTKCGAIAHYILGLQKLVDGKIVDITLPS